MKILCLPPSRFFSPLQWRGSDEGIDAPPSLIGSQKPSPMFANRGVDAGKVAVAVARNAASSSKQKEKTFLPPVPSLSRHTRPSTPSSPPNGRRIQQPFGLLVVGSFPFFWRPIVHAVRGQANQIATCSRKEGTRAASLRRRRKCPVTVCYVLFWGQIKRKRRVNTGSESYQELSVSEFAIVHDLRVMYDVQSAV